MNTEETPRGTYLKDRGMQQSLLPAGRTPMTGEAWDMIALGALVVPQFDSALFLGVGGGTVPRIVRWLFPKTQFTGVDFADVLELAEKDMHLNDIDWQLLRREGVEDFMGLCRSPGGVYDLKWDLVVEDLFVGYSKPSLNLYADFPKLVAPTGVYVANMPQSALGWYSKIILEAFNHVVTATCRGLGNVVVYASNQPISDIRVQAECTERFNQVLENMEFTEVK